MNFCFNINHLFKEEITKVDNQLQHCRQNGSDRFGFKNLQKMLYEVVDKMGEASAKAQNLPGCITTGKRLETPGQRLYIMKDSSTGDQSTVVGILKVGTKRLFVYDPSKVQHELNPLCVLDFYVHESRQREGCGRKLFEYMLRSEGIKVEHLAIDRPSPKFMGFLKKHFNLHGVIPQVNNFVIFHGFFDNRNDVSQGRNHGANYRRTNDSSWNPYRPPSGRRTRTPLEQQQREGREVDHLSSRLTNHSTVQPNHLGAGDVMYSRHGATPPKSQATPPVATPPNGLFAGHTPLGCINSQPSPISNPDFYFNGNRKKSASPHMYYTLGTNSALLNSQSSILSHNHTHQRTATLLTNEPPAFPKGPSSTPNFGSRAVADPRPASGDKRSSFMTRQNEQLHEAKNGSVMLPNIHNGVLKGSSNMISSGHNQQFEVLAQRPPSGKRSMPVTNQDQTSNPPLLQGNGPPQEYRMLGNQNPSHLGQNGSAILPFEKSLSPQQPITMTPNTHPSIKPPYAAAASPYGIPSQKNTSWTVMGVLREQRLGQNIGSRYNPGRLW